MSKVTFEEINKALDAIIDFLGRTRDIKDEVEKLKDLEICRSYFEDINEETVRNWTAIIIVHKAHNQPKEATKILMTKAIVRQKG